MEEQPEPHHRVTEVTEKKLFDLFRFRRNKSKHSVLKNLRKEPSGMNINNS
jgi:hypothetical protein